MKLHLEEAEIRTAITLYVTSKVKLEDSQHLEIEFASGRNPPTVSASVDILDNGETSAKADPAPGDDSAEKKPFSDEQQKLPFS